LGEKLYAYKLLAVGNLYGKQRRWKAILKWVPAK
jgi:hypothetical protein